MDDEPMINVCGMQVKVNDLFPPTMVGFISADGKSGVFADTSTGDSFKMTRNRSGFLVPEGTQEKTYSVAQHSQKLSDIVYDHSLGLMHDDMELCDNLLWQQSIDRTQRYWDNQIMSALTGTNSNPVVETLTMDNLEEMLDDARRSRLELDKKFIRAMRVAGLDVRVVEVVTRPLAILPDEYAEALHEVDREDCLEQYKRRSGMLKHLSEPTA